MAEVWVQKPSGDVGTIDDSELGLAVDAGYQVMTDAEVQNHQLEQSIRQDPTTYGESALRGLGEFVTFGKSNEWTDDKERLAALYRVRPIARVAGHIGGELGTAALMGPTSLGSLARRFVGGGRVAGMVAEEAAYGAYYGAMLENANAVVTGREASAEDLAIAATKDAAIGALGGAVLGGLGTMARKLGGKAVDAAGELVEGAGKVEGGVQGFAERAARATGVDIDVPGEGTIFEYFNPKTEKGRERLAKAKGAYSAKDGFYKAGRERVQETLDALSEVEQGLKRKEFAHEAYHEPMRGGLQNFTEQVRQELPAMGGMTPEYANRITKAIERAEQLSNKLVINENDLTKASAAAFSHADNLKREFGNIIEQAEREGLGDLVEELRPRYDQLKDFLETEAIWGSAAVSQKRVNATWSEIGDALDNFKRYFTETEKGGAFGARKSVVKDSSWKAFATTHIGDPSSAAYRRFQDFKDTVGRQAEGLRADYPEAFGRIDKAVKELDREFGKTAEAAMLERRLGDLGEVQKRLRKIADQVPGIGGIGIVSNALQMGPLAGFAMYTARSGIRSISSPVDMLHLQDVLTSMGAKTDLSIEKVVKGVGKAAVPEVEEKLAKYARQRVTFLVHLQGNDYNTVAQSLTAPDQVIAEKVAEQLGPLSELFPEQVAGAIETALRQKVYLQQHNPIKHDPVTGEAIYPSVSQQESFMVRVKAVRDPIKALKSISANKGYFEEIDALQNVYPETYGKLVNEIQKKVFEGAGQMSYQSRIMASMVLRRPVEPMITMRMLVPPPPSPAPETTSQRQGRRGGKSRKSEDYKEDYYTSSQSMEERYNAR